MNASPTFFMIDEAATLKRFDKLLHAVAYMRGYNVAFWLHFQALSQTKFIYGDAGDLIAGLAGIVQYFGGTGDTMTAQKISELTGKTTILSPSATTNTGTSGNSGSVSASLIMRDLIMPDEVMRLALPKQLVSYIGEGTVDGRLIEPRLSQFPDYLTFQKYVEEGFDLDQAVIAARKVQDERARRQAQPAPPPKPEPKEARFKMPSLDPFSLVDKGMAKLMGHEDK